jgi:hypothetical protein
MDQRDEHGREENGDASSRRDQRGAQNARLLVVGVAVALED